MQVWAVAMRLYTKHTQQTVGQSEVPGRMTEARDAQGLVMRGGVCRSISHVESHGCLGMG